MTKTLTAPIPVYTVDSCPDSPSIGQKLDKLLYDSKDSYKASGSTSKQMQQETTR
jgi:hypothetical protein